MADPNLTDLQPEVRRALGTATSTMDQAGIPYQITSGFRSRTEQQYLWDTRFRNPETGLPRGMVAKPGSSGHEFGRAVDITFHGASPEQTQQAFQVLQGNGFVRPYGERDRPHWELASLRPGGTQSGVWWDKANAPAPPVLPAVGDQQQPTQPSTLAEAPFAPVPSVPPQTSDALQNLIHSTVYGKSVSPSAGIPQTPDSNAAGMAVAVTPGVQELINSVRFATKS